MLSQVTRSENILYFGILKNLSTKFKQHIGEILLVVPFPLSYLTSKYLTDSLLLFS